MSPRAKRGGRYTAPKRGLRALVLTSDIPDDAPAEVREGLARRHLVMTTGRCPCGAELRVPENIEPGSVTWVAVVHEDDCPANDERLTAAIGGAK